MTQRAQRSKRLERAGRYDEPRVLVRRLKDGTRVEASERRAAEVQLLVR